MILCTQLYIGMVVYGIHQCIINKVWRVFAACLAGPVTATQGLLINIPPTNSTGRRRLYRGSYAYICARSDEMPDGRPDESKPFSLTICGQVDDPYSPQGVSRAANDANATAVPLMVVTQDEAYFGGKTHTNQLMH